MAVLNALKVKAADIMNAYIIAAPYKENLSTLLGPKFGKDKGHNAVVVGVLFGLKSASAAFRSHRADCTRHLGFESNKADPDLWMNEFTRESADGPKEYYSYILM